MRRSNPVLPVRLFALFVLLSFGCESNKQVSKQLDNADPAKIENGNQEQGELAKLSKSAVEHAGTKQGLDTALELFAKSRGNEKDEAFDLMADHFAELLNYDKMLNSFLEEIPNPSTERWLKKMISVADGGKQADAILAYARYVDQIPEFCDGFVKNPHLMAKLPRAHQDYLQAERTDSQREALVELLEQVIANDPEGKIRGVPYAQLAQKELYELQQLRIGMQAPDIVGEDLDGIEFRLSDYRGKVVMLDFWGHWCPPCRRMYPQERELVEKLGSKPFVLLGVNSDDKLNVAQNAVSDEGLVWRHFWNGKDGRTGNIADAWNIVAWPTVYLIDGEGVIRFKDILGDDLDRALEKLLAEQGHVVDLTMTTGT